MKKTTKKATPVQAATRAMVAALEARGLEVSIRPSSARGVVHLDKPRLLDIEDVLVTVPNVGPAVFVAVGFDDPAYATTDPTDMATWLTGLVLADPDALYAYASKLIEGRISATRYHQIQPTTPSALKGWTLTVDEWAGEFFLTHPDHPDATVYATPYWEGGRGVEWMVMDNMAGDNVDLGSAPLKLTCQPDVDFDLYLKAVAGVLTSKRVVNALGRVAKRRAAEGVDGAMGWTPRKPKGKKATATRSGGRRGGGIR